ncbi:MAG: DUF1553 domain-containing protein [Bacteroidota bacterium]
MNRYLGALLGLTVCLAACGPPISEDPDVLARLPEKVDFNYHIKPLLSDRCYSCHGPDENKREAGLRLDTEEGAFAALTESQGHAIVPGNLSKSAVFHRMRHEDPELLMPPPESNLSLDEYEIALINKWIDQGAEWKQHWSFIPLEPIEPPSVKQADWVQNPIDNFVLQSLDRQNIAPSPAAEKERILRRVTFDLTGLPPSLEEIDAFIADDSPDAYEKVVDRLLASDSYGERLAMEWMDVARYADSHGMHADGWRNSWPWRDWVIKAFNENLSYDQFVTWQLAGDLMPNATKEQILATAFHRNHPMTAEGGVVDEEFRLKYVFDRANTTATAFLGLTMECAQCHDHKFDPISQKEYYQMTAFFNNVKELGMTGDDGNYGPMLALPHADTEARLAELNQAIAEREQRQKLTEEEVKAKSDFLEAINPKRLPLKKGLVAELAMDKIGKGRSLSKESDNIVDRKAYTTYTGEIEIVEGKVGKALRFDDDYEQVYLIERGDFESWEGFAASVWVKTEKDGEPQTIMGNAGEKNNFWRGWEFYLDSLSRPSLRLISNLPDNYLQISGTQSIQKDQWEHVAFSYDGSGKAEGAKLYLNGKLLATEVEFDRLSRSIYPLTSATHLRTPRSIRIAKAYRTFTGEYGIFKGSMDELKLYERELSELEINALYQEAESKNELIANRENALRHYLLQYSDAYQSLAEELIALRKERESINDTLPEIMVMEEMPTPRATFVLNRGNYDEPTERVEAGTPAAVQAFSEGLPNNRLGLAQWIMSKENPLTSRVTVNRYWQMIFGLGLVRTPDDFGNQGALPSHPELLDWLAMDFMDSGWDVKHLVKTMVMSATYRQDSRTRQDLPIEDPNNDLLARGPRYRLPAEMIRDNALAASGLLNRKIGGESVKPYQPKGLWIEKGSFSHVLLNYKEDTGEDLYRRGMYTFIRRTSPPPSMSAFDAPDRSVCTIQRENTNTPLQALVLLNDPQYVEAARVMAERVQLTGLAERSDQIAMAFRLSTGRQPTDKELSVLRQQYETEASRFAKNPTEAKKLLSIGEAKRDESLNLSETAALAVVCSTILNMDDAYYSR